MMTVKVFIVISTREGEFYSEISASNSELLLLLFARDIKMNLSALEVYLLAAALEILLHRCEYF